MKIVLRCANYTLLGVNSSEFAEALDDVYFLLLDSEAILPIGTTIEAIDQNTTLSVINHCYNLEKDILFLDIDVEDIILSPQELIDYLKERWTYNPYPQSQT